MHTKESYTLDLYSEIAELAATNAELQHDLNGAKGAILNYAKYVVPHLESQNAELLDVVRDCVNFLADLDTKSDRAKALHKRAYTAHSKAKEK